MSEDTDPTRPLGRVDGRDDPAAATDPTGVPAGDRPAAADRPAAPGEPLAADRSAAADRPPAAGDRPADHPPNGEPPSEPERKGAPSGALGAAVATLREPEHRAWLLLAVAALSLVNLILLVAVLVTVREDLEDQVFEVEGQRCLLVEEEDANVLYCQR